MKYTFVVPVSRCFLFPLNCTINAAKHFGTTAEFNIIYDDVEEEIRKAYSNNFPFKITWHSLTEVYDSLPTPVSKDFLSKFWVTPWFLAAKLLDDYDSICILQADEFLMTNVDSLFNMAAKSDVVIATEYHVGWESEDLPFGTTKSIINRERYSLYDQLVFCGKSNRQILIDTYIQQCVEKWDKSHNSEVSDPLCAFNQACATHLNKGRIFGLDCNTWTWDMGAWAKRKLRYDEGRKAIYDEDTRLHGIHTKWWLEGVVLAGIERETNPSTREIIAHNYNIERKIMVDFNEMTPATISDAYEKTPFK